jgi:hypothetical protein
MEFIQRETVVWRTVAGVHRCGLTLTPFQINSEALVAKLVRPEVLPAASGSQGICSKWLMSVTLPTLNPISSVSLSIWPLTFGARMR